MSCSSRRCRDAVLIWVFVSSAPFRAFASPLEAVPRLSLELPKDLELPRVAGLDVSLRLTQLELGAESVSEETGALLIERRRGPFEQGPAVTIGRFGGFLAGWWAAALTHELGHALVAWGYGYSFNWPTDLARSEFFLPYWTVSPNDLGERPAVRRNIAAGGFLLSAAVSEAMLGLGAFPKSDVFVGGFVVYDTLNAVVYIARDIYYWSRDGVGIGDIRDMSRGGIPRGVIYGLLLVRSAVTLARVLIDPDFVRLQYWWSSAQPR